MTCFRIQVNKREKKNEKILQVCEKSCKIKEMMGAKLELIKKKRAWCVWVRGFGNIKEE